MKDLIFVILYWLHSVAAVVWIGGIFFILYAALPAIKELLGKEAGKLMGVIGKRFTPFANYSILVLVFSGIVMAILKEGSSEIWTTNPQWVISILLKVLIALVMVTIHFYRGLILLPRVGKMASELDRLEGETPAEVSHQITYFQRLSLNLVKVNLVLGMIVLLLSSIAIGI